MVLPTIICFSWSHSTHPRQNSAMSLHTSTKSISFPLLCCLVQSPEHLMGVKHSSYQKLLVFLSTPVSSSLVQSRNGAECLSNSTTLVLTALIILPPLSLDSKIVILTCQAYFLPCFSSPHFHPFLCCGSTLQFYSRWSYLLKPLVNNMHAIPAHVTTNSSLLSCNDLISVPSADLMAAGLSSSPTNHQTVSLLYSKLNSIKITTEDACRLPMRQASVCLSSLLQTFSWYFHPMHIV